MFYVGTNMTETIWLGTDDLKNVNCIELTKVDDESIFYVTASCNEDWVWAFWMDGLSNYEMIKYTIMDTAFECHNMNELMDTLDEIFAEDFADILADEDEDCDEDCCEKCNHRDCLN